MEGQNTISVEEYNISEEIQQHEDGALKMMMHFFAEELLPYLGIEGKVAALAPTELVYLELKKLYEDFNLVMEDGSWKHFEFQSTNEGLEGLKRFRTYEAMTSYQNKVSVITYVLYSGNIKRPMTEFTEGINTYRIYPIIMQSEDGDQLLEKLKEKMQKGEVLDKEDLIPLTLCPLMGGNTSQKERIRMALEIVRNAKEVDSQIISKIEAVIYTMAEKFLEEIDMDDVRRAVSMTRLGRMLVEDGIAEGISKGIIQNQMDLVKKKLQKGKTVEEIADDLEENVEAVRELIAKVQAEAE